MYMCAYIYIERERCMCIYIYIYTCIYIYIYIHTHTYAARPPARRRAVAAWVPDNDNVIQHYNKYMSSYNNRCK